MATALGFAFTQSMPVALTVFLALGFGMALPFLLLSFVPALGRFLPRPGVWMQTFRQVLAFPLYGTVVWLLWVLGNQVGINGVTLVLAACIALAFASWLWQKRHHSEGFARQVKTALVILAVGLALSVLASPFLQRGEGPGMAIAADANYEAYSAARLAELRAASQPVFVNMTAAWCITCLVNEKMVLSSDVVVKALSERGVTYLKGDWTNNDPAITEVLRQYDTAGVPLYLMFPADPGRPAEVLPQILRESTVLEALEHI
jgi:thiol:disulfide interchange protein DsbD